MDTNDKLPVYQKLIRALQYGYQALGTPARDELKEFITGSQNQNGGFNNRAGNSDLYYSLFGCWMTLAIDPGEAREKLRIYIDNCSADEPEGTIDFLSLLLMKVSLSEDNRKVPLLPAIRKIVGDRGSINLTYRIFLLLLLLDAQNRYKPVLLFVAKIWLFFYRPSGNLPCSLRAALLFARKLSGLNYRKEQSGLLDYYIEGSGFRVFERVKNCDMLSTAVSLFVLKETGYDLRLLAPGCLSFVGSNYESGAFMSGDGDQTLDLEYTFYGLLALGSLTRQ